VIMAADLLTLTRRAIDRAESKPQALTMLLMAPEFLRR